MQKTSSSRLVISQELNHHHTLYAGRLTEWFVESCFICAGKATGKPDNLVCLKIHSLLVKRPTQGGEIIDFENMVVRTGKTSLTVYGRVHSATNDQHIAEGFITFISVNQFNHPTPHHIVLDEAADAAELALREKAEKVFSFGLEERHGQVRSDES